MAGTSAAHIPDAPALLLVPNGGSNSSFGSIEALLRWDTTVVDRLLRPMNEAVYGISGLGGWAGGGGGSGVLRHIKEAVGSDQTILGGGGISGDSKTKNIGTRTVQSK